MSKAVEVLCPVGEVLFSTQSGINERTPNRLCWY